MTCGLAHAWYGLPEWQAVKLTFFAPCQSKSFFNKIVTKTSEKYTCQLSRLRVENFDLTPANACGPISHTWLKNVNCCRLGWHNFQKYVNSDPCKERKPSVKWINDNTFLAIPEFWSEKHWERACVYTHPKTGTRYFAFGRLRTSLEDFGLLQESSEMIVSSSKIPALPGQKSHAYISEKVGWPWVRKMWELGIPIF